MTSTGAHQPTALQRYTNSQVNISIAATNNESSLLVSSTLFDASAWLNTDVDLLYIEMMEIGDLIHYR